MRLVVDTNLMIRALLSPGPARHFFLVALLQHRLVYHPEQLLELREVAARPRLSIPIDAVNELSGRIERYGESVQCELGTDLGCRDPKDDYLLAVALAGKAEAILTEDDDLLVLSPWRGVKIARLFLFLQEHPLVG